MNTVNAGQDITISFGGATDTDANDDVDNLNAVFSISPRSDFIIITGNVETGWDIKIASGTTTNDDQGLYQINLIVSDQSGASSSYDILIEVAFDEALETPDSGSGDTTNSTTVIDPDESSTSGNLTNQTNGTDSGTTDGTDSGTTDGTDSGTSEVVDPN